MTTPPTKSSEPPKEEPSGSAQGRLLMPGRVLLERYELIEELGAGAMASVWSAHDTQSSEQTKVAIKAMKPALRQYPKLVERFRREALAANNFSHPNIVKVLEYGSQEETPLLVMEFINGPSLSQRLRKEKRPLEPAEWVRLGHAMLDALEICHQEGIIHRDVKAGNILFDESGHPKLADFGIAHLTEAMALTRTLEVLGTPRYMAPECLRGEKATPGSDLFSLGRSLMFAATGSPTKTDLPRLYPEPLLRWVRFLLAIDPERRYANCSEARSGLKEATAGQAPASPTSLHEEANEDLDAKQAAETLKYTATALKEEASNPEGQAQAEPPRASGGEESSLFDPEAPTEFGQLGPKQTAPWHQHPAFLFGLAALGTALAAAFALDLF